MMSSAIAHRGPDGEGLYLTRESEPISLETPQVALAFRRLAILDPDSRAMQPMQSPDGRYSLLFNGEIYNFRALRDELAKLLPDYTWKTTGDSEVLLMAYAQWGTSCLQKLNGMFAIAIWDAQENSLFLARDRMGQKPLYLSVQTFRALTQDNQASPRLTQRLAFASEIGALRALGVAPKKTVRLDEYLSYGCVCGFATIEPSISKIAPGYFATLNANGGQNLPYFSLMMRSPKPTQNARALIEQAVERQLVSDVPLGVLLSGGIDSSVIAACARKHGPVQTFSVGFDDPRYDETAYAREVAKHLGADHHEFRITPDAIDDLPKLAAVFGEPFADSSALPMHYLARETRKFVKVALGGDGGDELFGGYDRYRALRASQRLERFSPELVSKRLGELSTGHPKSLSTRVGRLFKSLALPMDRRYASYLRVFDDAQLRELGVDPLETDEMIRSFSMWRRRGLSPVEAATATDRELYLPEDLLTKVDRCSMLHNLEVRSPFMDHELVEFAAGLSEDQLIGGGPKRPLREAFAKDLPESVFKRKKMGFAVPIGEWFRGPLRAMLHDSLTGVNSFARLHFNMTAVQRMLDDHQEQQVDHSQRLYALLMLELWNTNPTIR